MVLANLSLSLSPPHHTRSLAPWQLRQIHTRTHTHKLHFIILLNQFAPPLRLLSFRLRLWLLLLLLFLFRLL